MYPDWVVKHKQKGTNISCIDGRYYLYEVSSVWNKEKGRAQKVTNKYLGRITEDGFIPSKISKKSSDYKKLYKKAHEKCKELENQIEDLEKEIDELKSWRK